MLRLSKLADYGIVLATYMAHTKDGEVSTARGLSERSTVPLPTVSKVLKSLARAGVLVAHRGKRGGYTLARAPEQISVVELISAIDGPIALTECSSHEAIPCDLQLGCPVSSNWARITAAVERALTDLTLADMANPEGCGTTTQPQLVELAPRVRRAAPPGASDPTSDHHERIPR